MEGRGARLHAALTCAAAALFASVAVVPAQALPPAYLSPPVLGGDPAVGRTLTCSPGDWFRASAFAYSWRRGASVISGQTSSTYVVRPADRGRRISCSVTASNNIGEYTIVVPTGGAVDLRFSPEADSPLAPEFLGGTSSSKGATTIVATEADPKSGVDVVLSLGGVVAGRVTVQGTGAALLQGGNATADAATIPTDTASVSGTVTYGAGSPVAHTQVCVDGFTACTSTNAAGEYTLGGLAAGTHNINFSGEDLVDGANAIDERVAEAAGLDVTLAEGEARQGVDAQLRLGGRISGTVVGPSGQPLGNVQVCTTEPFHEGPNYFPPGPQSCSYTNSSASTSSASSNELLVPVPSSAFALVARARVGRALHEIDFSLATTQPGTLTWELSFCSPPTVRHGRCVRGSIPFAAAGTEKVAAGTKAIRVRPDARALRALRAGQTLHVTARLRFQSALGGAPRSREVLLTVAPARPRPLASARLAVLAPASRKSAFFVSSGVERELETGEEPGSGYEARSVDGRATAGVSSSGMPSSAQA
jgi:Carboxypeptidase regulatory-like domain